MAVRIENANVINFGNAGSTVTITHFEVLYGPSGSRQSFGVRPLTAQVVVNRGQPMRFDSRDLDIVLPSGQIADAAWKRFVDAAVTDSTEGWQVRAYTDSSTEVNVRGYAAQTVAGSAWFTTTEAD